MKIARNWIILLVFLVILSVILFITGRQHNVYVENKARNEYVAVKDIKYSLDGDKEKKIKPNKRKAEVVKGRSHKIVVEFKDAQGNKQKIEKDFDVKATEDLIIYLPVLIGNGNDWVEEFVSK